MNIYLLSALFCLVFLFATVELIRRRKLQEQYALLWLLLGFVMAGFSLFPQLLERISRAVHIVYAPSLLFLIGLLCSLVLILHLTIVISRLHRRVTRLIQELALMQERERRGGRA
ncbi:hypothetical protein SD70_09265 [Gordoniibacillus kamchatkensis]|uniref:DUF2304 domain-containing protein n=1 Tax=Gordoniibacillus kamchatkensis TaxID=1590651 RepID=A0ABR5AJP3_9BACL|nr:DUF2304 domain-containing protein [Paenibacillus sp. VKM B-2647]KIL41196.1 hypothetical protein SD70_09265 [Paenibacillus sp. VKM B-2647]